MQGNSKITMLGTGNAAVTKCYNTCFTIHNGNDLLLVDGGGGNGILVQLEKAGIEINDIHDIFITHAHTDHILGIIWIVRTIAQRMQQGKYNGDLNVYSHDKAILVLDWICRNTLPKKIVARIGNGINFNVLSENDKFSAAGMEIQCFDIYSTKEKQFGFKAVTSDNKTIVCLGDEPYNENNKEYVKNADWLMCEAFCLYEDRDVFKPYEKHHSTALDAGVQAEELGVKNLLLYHTEDKTLSSRKEKYTAEAKKNFNGNVYVPDDLEVLDL
ncbi:MBL fold metallo-hydrolase [Bacteroides sp. ET336]|uniref:MBL fold metallo-hydrolase n=1 Tax=Bacteroides sp. ET336 TaxID=2972459 RepID=UPI0021ABCF78|nr:MBL fold metallo-hydrolase [Bacteroides sp. ET336]MCR8893028.1 MBL fold metallo-hydrolase [Bacteroides sp. ET336]MDN0057525.1 MBL fold metallo-hydrolase [Bacteroides caecigallinarum]